jgi:hypothetical protein
VSDKCHLVPGKKAFAQRDFVFLLRSLRREMEKERHAAGDVSGEPMLAADGMGLAVRFKALIKSLRRNFNGVPAADFRDVIGTVLKLPFE